MKLNNSIIMFPNFTKIIIGTLVLTIGMYFEAMSQSTSPPLGIAPDEHGQIYHESYPGINDLNMTNWEIGQENTVFGNCCAGELYVGFKIFLNDFSVPTTPWDYAVTFGLYDQTGTQQWTHTLSLDMNSQEIMSLVFHSDAISSDENWYIKVISITNNDAPLSALRFGFDYYLKENAAVDFNSGFLLNPMMVDGEIQWTQYDWADEYEVEWVFYEQSEIQPALSPADKPFEEKSPVRVITSSSPLAVDNVYPTGTLYYRVRSKANFISNPDRVVLGAWNYPSAQGVSVSNLNPLVTWQRVSSFAENAKKKHVISFYDKMMKQQQVITNLSQAEETMVAESKYDFEGRKVIDFLPVPLGRDGFNYVEANRFEVSGTQVAAHHKKAYDKERRAGLETTLDDDVSAAADYYDPAPEDYDAADDQGIPSAGQFPYTQVSYTNDGSGRVVRQSGVGEQFQIDSDQAIKYFYGSASEEELASLFGSDNFGKASHYRKNLVQDANQQVSVTYLDASGRTVATALAGDSHDNLDELPDILATEDINIDISNHYNWTDGSKVTHYKFLNVAPSTNVAFSSAFNSVASSISMTAEDFDLDELFDLDLFIVDGEVFDPSYKWWSTEAGATVTVCASCVYDVEITITDPYGIVLAQGGIQTESGGQCADDTDLSDYFPDLIFNDVGEYTITKVVTPHEITYEEAYDKVRDFSWVSASLSNLTAESIVDYSICDVVSDNGSTLTEAVIPEMVSMGCENIKQLIIDAILVDQDRSETDPEYRSTTFTYDELSEAFEDTEADAYTTISTESKYCEYTFCQQNTASEEFDLKLFLITSWTGAAAYDTSDEIVNLDPFFSTREEDDAYLIEMHDLLDHIVLIDESLPIDPAMTFEYTPMPIEDLVDPTNQDMMEYGKKVNGTSLLYYSTEDLSTAEVAIRRWQLYRGFYLEAKRKVKLLMANNEDCASLVTSLSEVDGLPLTESDVFNHGATNGVIGPVTHSELDFMVASLEMGCAITLSDEDQIDVFSALQAYFRLAGYQAYRVVKMDDLLGDNPNPYLVIIRDILAKEEYSCVFEDQSLVVEMECVVNSVPCDEVNVIEELELTHNYNFEPNPTPIFEYAPLYFVEGVGIYNSLLQTYDPSSSSQFVDQPEHRNLMTIPQKDQDLLRLIADHIYIKWTFFNSDNEFGGYSFWLRNLVHEDDIVEVVTMSHYGSVNNAYPDFISDPANVPTNGLPLAAINLNMNSPGGTQIGSIPLIDQNYENIKLLRLSGLGLTGNIDNLQKLKGGLIELDLSRNNLSGKVPLWLNEIEKVDLSGNYFQLDDIVDFVYARRNLGLDPAEFTFRNTEYIDTSCSDCPPSPPPFTVDHCSTVKLTTNNGKDIDAQRGILSCEYRWKVKKIGSASFEYVQENWSESNNLLILNNVDQDDEGVYYCEIRNLTPGMEGYKTISPWETLSVNQNYVEICTTPSLSFHTLFENYQTECRKNADEEAEVIVEIMEEEFMNTLITEYIEEYKSDCKNSFTENFSLGYTPKEYHYTLYYYDRAGNLVQTVPPKGVELGSFGNYPLTTNYQYNSLNQLVEQDSPDGGVSKFKYNSVGQLRISQNAKQLVDQTYSYTKYDRQGRIVEVGLMSSPTASDNLDVLSSHLDEADFPQANAYVLTQMTKTYYDRAANPSNEAIYNWPADLNSEYLRGRVALTEVWGNESNSSHSSSTLYSYDPHGNVKAIVQNIRGLGQKRTDYVYDLISGNVKYVMYQREESDSFMHRYHYDDDNRITEVHTSVNGVVWDRDALYEYYDHGPLKNIQLGEAQVQHLDYYYTLQGWLKGINVPNEPDAFIGSNTFAKDEFAMTLGYYQGDFESNHGGVTDDPGGIWASVPGTATTKGLFNGNISWMTTEINQVGEQTNDVTAGRQAMMYRYDQLNRIITAQSLASNASGVFARSTANEGHDSEYSYDPNGNLKTLDRKDQYGHITDQLAYNYDHIDDEGKMDNWLTSVKNEDPESNHYLQGPVEGDGGTYPNLVFGNAAYAKSGTVEAIEATESIIFEPGFFTEEGADFTASITTASPSEEISVGEFDYDEIGNLTANTDDGTQIDWTVYGKVASITHDNGDQVDFKYDAAGNRIRKRITPASGSVKDTHYVRDASGNVMAVYQDGALKEQPIYGSSRLGQYTGGTVGSMRQLGHKNYELSNHLGNVVAVVGDDLYVNDNGEKEAVVHSVNDYYPFGLEKPGRSFAINSSYRYGFNGKEKDQDGEFGSTTTYDYGFRIYNPSIGRFLSVDPLTQSFPWYTPYQFAGNKPIWAIDLDGLEEADPQQMRAAEQYYQKTKLNQSEVFPNITTQQINDQVHARIRNLGKSIGQGKFFLCGPAAAGHVAASHDPLAYVKTVFDLYLNGFANGKAIKVNDEMLNARPDKDGNIDGIAAVDWILLHSLRSSENAINWGGYDPHSKDDINKMTLKSEFSDLVVRLGSNISFSSSNRSLSSSTDLAGISEWVDGGKRAVLFINSRAYRGQDSGDGIDGWVSENYGRHFIVLKGISQKKGGGIKVSYWDYGNSSLKSKEFGSFGEFKASTFNYWLIKNEGQKKKDD